MKILIKAPGQSGREVNHENAVVNMKEDGLDDFLSMGVIVSP